MSFSITTRKDGDELTVWVPESPYAPAGGDQVGITLSEADVMVAAYPDSSPRTMTVYLSRDEAVQVAEALLDAAGAAGVPARP